MSSTRQGSEDPKENRATLPEETAYIIDVRYMLNIQYISIIAVPLPVPKFDKPIIDWISRD